MTPVFDAPNFEGNSKGMIDWHKMISVLKEGSPYKSYLLFKDILDEVKKEGEQAEREFCIQKLLHDYKVIGDHRVCRYIENFRKVLEEREK